MRDDKKPHPGPWRVPQVDSEFAGLILAAGIVVLGLVSMPTLAPIFLLAAVFVGVLVALLLHFTKL